VSIEKLYARRFKLQQKDEGKESVEKGRGGENLQARKSY
jgi:hypothetical protein